MEDEAWERGFVVSYYWFYRQFDWFWVWLVLALEEVSQTERRRPASGVPGGARTSVNPGWR